MKTDRMAAAHDRELWSRRANDIRARLAVSVVVGRVVALKKSSGPEFTGLCPFHNERTPSFTVNDKKAFFHCFGCGEHGDALGFVMRHRDLGFQDAVELLESQNGLRHLQATAPVPAPPRVPQREDLDKAAKVARIWDRDTRPVSAGDPVDRYLRGRCLVPPADYGFGDATINAGWPVDLRFAPALWHGKARLAAPAMVAAMRRTPDGPVAAVHRTYLKVTGVGVGKAGLEGGDKLMFGDPKGACIFLGPIVDRMCGGEGIETSLSAMQMWRRSGLAFGSRALMATVEPPFACSDFVYAADRNKPHPDPAHSRVGERAAWQGAKAFGTGRTMTVRIPKLGGDGLGDFNDVLVEQARVAAQPSPFARALASQKARGIEHGPAANVVREGVEA